MRGRPAGTFFQRSVGASFVPVTPDARTPIALLIVGDELLSGKRRDGHFAQVVALLAERGRELAEVRFVGDDEARIADALRQLVDSGCVVLCSGGIGATPDDRTRQAVARAFDRRVERHAEAERRIVARYGERAWPNRVLMADFPAGAELIPNPVNDVAGFSVHPVYCVPGFPEMAWPMFAWVLDGPLRGLRQRVPPREFRLQVTGTRGEGDLLELMEALLARFPDVQLSSLPHRGVGGQPHHIEFGVKGPLDSSARAYRWLAAELARIDGTVIVPLAPPEA